MTPSRRWFVVPVSFAAFLAAAPAPATTLRSMNLEALVSRAEKVFRGTVLQARAGTVEVGGGRLPIVTYRVRVDESFKGSYETMKGIRVAEIKMLGRTDPIRNGKYQRNPVLRDVPVLAVGESYLLMTTQPEPCGPVHDGRPRAGRLPDHGQGRAGAGGQRVPERQPRRQRGSRGPSRPARVRGRARERARADRLLGAGEPDPRPRGRELRRER